MVLVGGEGDFSGVSFITTPWTILAGRLTPFRELKDWRSSHVRGRAAKIEIKIVKAKEVSKG